jgi:hypothetical protein
MAQIVNLRQQGNLNFNKLVMMKKIIFLVLSFLATSCFYSGKYVISLQNVESSNNKNNSFTINKLVEFTEGDINKYSYEDSLINIIWTPTANEFHFSILNKTKNTIRIIWDNAIYIDENSSSNRIVHGDIKLSETNNSQVPTSIARGSKINDMVVPIHNISFKGYWKIKPFFQYSTNEPEELKSLKEKYVGKTVSILLPISIKEQEHEYIFSFKIDDFLYKEPKNTNKKKKPKFIDPVYN